MELVKEYKSTVPAYQKEVHTIIRNSYSHHYRRMMPKILDALVFKSNNQMHRPVIDALNLLKKNRDSRQRYFSLDEAPTESVIRNKWQDIVIEKDSNGVDRVNRINYEISVLQVLRDKLRCKEIWVVGADRYRNPEEDLPGDLAENKEKYFDSLGHPIDATPFVKKLQQTMHTKLTELNVNLPNNTKWFMQTNAHGIFIMLCY